MFRNSREVLKKILFVIFYCKMIWWVEIKDRRDSLIIQLPKLNFLPSVMLSPCPVAGVVYTDSRLKHWEIKWLELTRQLQKRLEYFKFPVQCLLYCSVIKCIMSMKCVLFWYLSLGINKNSHNNLSHELYLLCLFCYKVLHKHPLNKRVDLSNARDGKKKRQGEIVGKDQ